MQGHVDVGLGLVLALQALYVVDSIFNEASILSTMDITVGRRRAGFGERPSVHTQRSAAHPPLSQDDGFGFMLCFGDLAWVPAMYSLQARFLAENPQALSPAYAAVCFAVALGGFYIFRASNAQKDTFRNAPEDPSVRGLPFIRTKVRWGGRHRPLYSGR